MKRLVFISISLLLLLVLIPGCFTFQTQAPNPTPAIGQPSVIGDFSSNPSTINSGGTSTLAWNVTGADTVTIDQGIGMVNVAGSREVAPVTSTVYTITATNSAGTVTRSATTTVDSASSPAMPFAVTSVIAKTEPSTFTGACPKTFTFYATITANGPGTATYIWESTDGGEYSEYSETQSVTFYEAGTKTTTLQWEFRGSGFGLHRVHVLTPNDIASNMVYYEVNCDGDPLMTGITLGIIPSESGSMVKGGGMNYTKSHSVCAGDTGGSLASRAFLSFDISSIPGNAVIDAVVLNIGGYTTTGSPTYADPINGPQYGNFGAMEIYRYQYGKYEDLDTYSYNGMGELVASGKMDSYPLSPWNLNLKIQDPASGKFSVQGLIIAGQPTFQLRAQFFTSTNWDSVADMLCFEQSTLTVKYHLP